MSLRAEGVEFGYRPGRPVLRALTADLMPGRVTAILGPNGAGKTTLLRVWMGLVTPGSGRVTLDGAAVGGLSRVNRARRMVYVPQQSALAFAFSVRAVVAMGLYASGEAGDRARVEEALAEVDLLGAADEPFGTLSAGQQQRVTLARALAQLGLPCPGGTRCLLADEPVSAMDPRHALRCLGLMRSLAEAGIAVGMVLHDLSAALRFADEVIVMSSEGSVASAGSVQQTIRPAVLGPVFGVSFREIGEGGRRVGMVPEAALDSVPEVR